MKSDRLHRLLRVIVLLQGRTGMNVREMMASLGVSRRTVFRDLASLEEAGVPVTHDIHAGYRIARSFFLPPTNVTDSELLGLQLLSRFAQAHRAQPLFAEGLSGIDKVLAAVDTAKQQRTVTMMKPVTVEAMAHDTEAPDSRDFLALQQAIHDRLACQIHYRSPSDPDPIITLLHPHALHFAGRAWYVIGHAQVYDEVRTFKLVRIEKVDVTTLRFEMPSYDAAAAKIGQAWRLLPEGAIHDIELIFSRQVARNVAEVHWHDSQQTTMQSDGSCRMAFRVDGLGEISWWLAGYADQVTVVRPAILRERLRRMMEAAAQRHSRPEE